jgi:uncharacterized protein YwqG
MPRRPSAVTAVRLAFVPVVKRGDGEATASKFSGTPWLAKHEAWPVCPYCRRPRQLFLQLDLDDLPGDQRGTRGSGLLQMFYCVEGCDAEENGWDPFSDVGLVRVVRPKGPARTKIDDGPARRFPARRIVGWKAREDLPNEAEADERHVTLVDAQRARLEKGTHPLSHDKLAGWPCWVQGVEYPRCPRCKTPMELLFQIDSEDHVPYMFGDTGCGHITQCRKHRDVVAFGWACC